MRKRDTWQGWAFLPFKWEPIQILMKCPWKCKIPSTCLADFYNPADTLFPGYLQVWGYMVLFVLLWTVTGSASGCWCKNCPSRLMNALFLLQPFFTLLNKRGKKLTKLNPKWIKWHHEEGGKLMGNFVSRELELDVQEVFGLRSAERN